MYVGGVEGYVVVCVGGDVGCVLLLMLSMVLEVWGWVYVVMCVGECGEVCGVG